MLTPALRQARENLNKENDHARTRSDHGRTGRRRCDAVEKIQGKQWLWRQFWNRRNHRDHTHLHWRANVAGEEKEWDAEITEQIPDNRIAWRSVTGVKNGGVVTFHKISDTVTRIALQMDYEPEGALETLGDALGAVRMEARANLANLKELLEQRGSETGAWRGKVDQH
jgi:hypothetical protein